MFQKVGFSLLLCTASLYSGLTQATLANFDAGVSVTVSSDLNNGDFATYFYDSGLAVDGLATGEASGSGDAFGGVGAPGGPDFDFLEAGETRVVTASASGDVTGDGAVWSYFQTDGLLYLDNSGGAEILSATVSFDIYSFADIFTSSLLNIYADVFAEIVIIDSFDNEIFNIVFDFVSDLDGVGNVGDSGSDSFSVVFDIAADDYEFFYIELAVGGYAESVPEPNGIFLVALGLLFVTRSRKSR